MNHRKIIVFCGPSGSGKTSIVKDLLNYFSELAFSISATTRDKRKNEVDGQDYYFIPLTLFTEKITKGEFVEFEEVYQDIYYGTLWAEIERIISIGKIPILDIDVYGATTIKEKYKTEAFVFFVHPGNEDNILKRLSKRSTENEESMLKRLAKSREELLFANNFDHCINNDGQLSDTITEVRRLVQRIIDL
ncbi:MAG: guanylate kinase [Bacteroidetes bacterium]|nr:guanylate kinase [Bacteroidota bacterium]